MPLADLPVDVVVAASRQTFSRVSNFCGIGLLIPISPYLRYPVALQQVLEAESVTGIQEVFDVLTQSLAPIAIKAD